VIRFDKERVAVVHAQHFEELQQRLLSLMDGFHQESPLEEGISREELRSRLGKGVGPRLYHALLQDLVKLNKLVVQQHLCRRPGHQVQTAAQSIRPLADQILRIYDLAGLGSPREAEVVQKTGAAVDQVGAAIKLLIGEGKLVRMANLLFTRQHVDALQEKLVAHLRQEGEITTTRFKELVGLSRKYSIPLAEYFDAQKVTLRIGEVRKLRT